MSERLRYYIFFIFYLCGEINIHNLYYKFIALKNSAGGGKQT